MMIVANAYEESDEGVVGNLFITQVIDNIITI